MNIEGIVWLRTVVDKLAFKHTLKLMKLRKCSQANRSSGFLEKGEREGANVYEQTPAESLVNSWLKEKLSRYPKQA